MLEDLSLEEYRQFDEAFEEDVYDAIDLDACVRRRISEGGTAVASVEKQIAYVTEKIAK